MSSPQDRAPRRGAHRPVPLADLTALIDAEGGWSAFSPAELASATAAAVVHAGRGPAGTDPRFVELADRVGLDTLAELWRDSDPQSLPGALWVLYVLRQWCRTAPDTVARLWRAGEPYAPADAVVAGVSMAADAAAVQRLSDDVLGGAYRGDLAVALERAAAFFRVIAAGRREGVTGDADRAERVEMADRNERAADGLAAAAARWRAGELT